MHCSLIRCRFAVDPSVGRLWKSRNLVYVGGDSHRFELTLYASTRFSGLLRSKVVCVCVQLPLLLFRSACNETRLEWYFNNLRIRHAMRPTRLALLPSGTGSNEALHAEINGWFRQTQARDTIYGMKRRHSDVHG